MRKNKVISPSSKPLLKNKNINISKNKLLIKTSFNSPQKYPPNQSDKYDTKVFSPRNIIQNKKSTYNSIKSMQNSIKHQQNIILNQNSKETNRNLMIVCENNKLKQDLQVFGIKNTNNVILVNANSQLIKKTVNFTQIIILSTLQEFTSIYVNLITSLSIDISQTQNKQVKAKIRWFIICNAINSKSIETNFKQCYPQVEFMFFNNVLYVVNIVNLLIQGFIYWEVSKNKFQIKNQQNYQNLNHKNQNIVTFKQIICLNFKQNNLPQQKLTNQYICIKEEQISLQDEIYPKLKQNKVYISNKKYFQKYLIIKNISNTLQKQQNAKIHKIIYLSHLQPLQAHFLIKELLQTLIKSNKLYFFHLIQNFNLQSDHNFNNFTLKKLYQINQKQKQSINILLNSQNQLFSSKYQQIQFNQQEIIKILKLFIKKSNSKYELAYIISPSFNKFFKQTDSELFNSVQQNLQFIYLQTVKDLNLNKINSNIKKQFTFLNIPVPLFFVILQNQNQNPYKFNEICPSVNLSLLNVKIQIFKRIKYKKLSQNQGLNNISKKIALYGIKSANINQQNSFIHELCYFLNTNIKFILQKQKGSNNNSLFLCDDSIKNNIQETKNKINILFGKIASEQQKNEIFRSFLVIYLPKMQKINFQKLITTISKAYEKFFNLIDSQECSSSQMHYLQLFMFNLSNLAILSNFQNDFSEFIHHYSLNQFQKCLKNLGSTKIRKSSVKTINYIIFKMQEYVQEYEKLIDNARMKNDCEIQIYLKFGQQFIHRPKNGKYKFIKANELKNQIKNLIQKSIRNDINENFNETNFKKLNKFEQINKMINASIIQQSPKKQFDFFITPIKIEQKSTYSPQNSLINEMIQQDHEKLSKFIDEKDIFNTFQLKNNFSDTKYPTKLYLFLHKSIPLKCLLNRNQANYDILTYNSPDQPMLIRSYLQSHQYVVVIKKQIQQAAINQFMPHTQFSYKINKNLKESNMNLKFKTIQLKQMSEKQVTKIIDSLIYELKLKKTSTTKSNKFINEIPLLIYQCKDNSSAINKQSQNRLKKIKSQVNFQNKLKSSSKLKLSVNKLSNEDILNSIQLRRSKQQTVEQIKSEYFEKDSNKRLKKLSVLRGFQNLKQKNIEIVDSNINIFSTNKNSDQQSYYLKNMTNSQHSKQNTYIEPEIFQNFINKFKVKISSSNKYFLIISQHDFQKLYTQYTDRFIKICQSTGINLYFFGNQTKIQKLQVNLDVNSKFIIHHIESPKQLLLKFFDPFIKPFDKGLITNKFKLSVSQPLIIYRLIEQENQKKKIPQKLWNMSSRSQKSLSNTSIKLGSPNKQHLIISNVSSSTSLKCCEDNSLQINGKHNPVLSYYYSKQLIKQKPLKNYMNLFHIVGSSGCKQVMKKEKMAFKKVKISEYFTCIQDLMTILWQNGQKKYFLIILMTAQQLEDLVSNVFFVKQMNLSLSDVIIIQLKQDISKVQNEAVDLLNLLMSIDSKINNCVLTRKLKLIQESIQEIQVKIQHYVTDIIELEGLLDKKILQIKLKQQISCHNRDLLNYNNINHKIYVVICFVEDFQYLKPLIDSIIYKNEDQQNSIKLLLQKVESIEHAMNLNSLLMVPHCLIIPSQWSYLKIGSGIMIDYNLQHFQRKLGIFLNNMLMNYFKKNKLKLFNN